MSKFLKNVVSDELAKRLAGVDDALLVNVVGLDANRTVKLRQELRQKNIRIMVVKNSLVRRATEGTPLAAAFAGIDGTYAVVWGAEDIVSLAKEVVRLAEDKAYEGFEARGGVMGGEQLSPEKVKEVSKWPSREEQLSLLVGQILGPGATLAAQLIGPASTLAGQIKQKSEEEGDS
jgi:ribosomal protein L10